MGIWRRCHKELKKKNATPEEFEELTVSGFYDVDDIDLEIDRVIALDLLAQATPLDIEIPQLSEQDMWTKSNDGRYTFLSRKGRRHIRQLVDAEKARRFEVKTLWVTKFWLPLLAALIGIIGALTGLVAVLRHKP